MTQGNERSATSWLDGVPMDPIAVTAEPLPTVPGFPFLHAGNAALISGPTGAGRSSLVQACAYDAAQVGIRVAYLGSEVTEPEFNARAADLAARRGDAVDDELREQLARVKYLNLASVIAHAWTYPAQWVEQAAARFDVVLVDPLSAVASVLDLDFDKSNTEFVRFYDRLVQPLCTAGVSSVLLENIGHSLEARGRAKGASAKPQRADLTFSCKQRANPAGLIVTVGKVRTIRAAFKRGDSWTFDRDTQRLAAMNCEHVEEEQFRPTLIMERVSRFVAANPGAGRNEIRKRVKGGSGWIDTALRLLLSEGFLRIEQDGQSSLHYSIEPYRDSRDTTGTQPGQSPGADDRDTGTPSFKGPGPGVPGSADVNGNATGTLGLDDDYLDRAERLEGDYLTGGES